MMKKQESVVSLKRTLSMRNQMDEIEKEMTDKCDAADAKERKYLIELKEDLNK